jgi:hypothetical protein
MRRSLLLLLLSLPLCAQSYKGLGASTLTCLDKDGDGYGVGTTCTGRDADDDDPAVHTAAEAVTKWGTMQAFLVHRGYSTVTTSTRYWVISTSGNDGTCASRTFTTQADPTAAPACATWGHIQGLILAGDIVFWRAGTHTGLVAAHFAVTGTSSAPILYMGYPGEAAVIDAPTGMQLCAAGLGVETRDYISVENLKFTYTTDTTGAQAINLCYNDHLTLRYIEVDRHGQGFYGGDGSANNLFEYNVIHDTNLYGSATHGMYIVARTGTTPAQTNMVIRNNICWNPGVTCIQHTGPVTNLVIEGNLIYNVPATAASAISLEQRNTNSFIRNNVVFNSDVKALVFAIYESTIATNLPGDQNNNLIENNTFIIPAKKWENGAANSAGPVIQVGVANPGIACGSTYDQGHNTYRNNVIMNLSGGPSFYFTSYTGDANGTYLTNGQIDPRTWSATTTWINNTIYQPSTTNVLYYSNQSGTIGTPPCGIPTLVQGYQDLATFLSSAGSGTTGNLTSNPTFTAYLDTYWSTPSSFDFRPQSTSPTINAGVSSTATIDVIGHGRTTTPTIGAYQNNPGGTAITNGTWVSLTPAGLSGWKDPGWSKALYIPSLDSDCIMANYRDISTEPNMSFVCYRPATNNVVAPLNQGSHFHNPYGPEGGHPVGGIAYDSSLNLIYDFGRFSGSQVAEKPQWQYWFDVGAQAGRSKHLFTTATSKPNYNINLPSCEWDSAVSKVICHGGDQAFTGTSLWTPATNVWERGVSCTAVAGNCPNPGVSESSSAFRTANGQMYLFGGVAGATLYSDVFRFNSGTNTWVKLSPGGSIPTARVKAAFAYDSNSDAFLMYGGSSTYSAQTVLYDTWIYDPKPANCAGNADGCWTQLSPTDSPYLSNSAVFWRMSYHAAENLFVMWVKDNGADNPLLYVFRYAGNGPGVGRISAPTYTPTSGGRNRGTGWADRPHLVNDGTSLYLSHTETDVGPTNGIYMQPYVDKITTANTITSYGTYNSIASDLASLQGDDAQIANVNGTLHVCYHAGNNSNYFDKVFGKSWGGSSWSGAATPIQNAGDTPGLCSIMAIGSTAYVAVNEPYRTTIPQGARIFVYSSTNGGTTWTQVGSSPINITSTNRAEGVKIYSNGSQPCVAWSEYTSTSITNGTSDTPPQAYASCWNGTSAWAQVGSSSVNVDATEGAYAVTAAYFSGNHYLAFTERSNGGVQKLYIRKYNGSAWVTVGTGAYNKDTTTGWVFRPDLTADGSNLYLAWDEQQTLGVRPQIYVSSYNGTAWTDLGASLNADATNGSARHPSITVLSGKPYVAWAEVKYGAMQQIYAKEWSGSVWQAIGAASGPAVGSAISGTVRVSGSIRIQ